MASGPTIKIRMVKCPKCLRILPEPPNVPIYTCGGCDTHLRAKVRRTDAGNTALNSDETNAAQTNGSVHVSDGELQGSPGFHSLGESSLNQNGGSGEITYSNSNAEQHLTASHGERINMNGHDESGDDTYQLRGQSNGDIENETDGSGSGDLGDEQVANESLSNEDQSNVSGHDEFGDDIDQLRGQSNGDIENETDGSGDRDLGDELIANVNLSNEDQSNVSGHDGSGGDNDQLRGQSNGDIKNETDGSVDRDLGDELVANVNLSNEDQSNVSGHDESGDDTDQLRGQSNGDIKNETDGSGDRDLGDELIANVNLSNEDQCNVSGHDESGDDVDQLRGQSNGDIKNETNGSGSGDLGNEQVANESLSSEDQNSETDDCGFLEHNAEQPRIYSDVFPPTGLGHAEILKKQLPLFSEDEERESNNNHSKLEEVKAKVDAHNEGNTMSKEAHSGQIDETNGSTSVLTIHQLAQENMLEEFHALSCDEQLEQHQESVDHSQRLVDTRETTEFINRSSEFSDNLVDLSKSPTTRSSRAYYDDGVSSNEGTDNQLHDLRRQSFRKAQKPPHYVASGERPKKEKYLLNNNDKMQHQLRNESPVFSRKRDDIPKTVRFDRDEQLNPEKIDHPNWWRMLEDASSSRVPFYHRNPLAGYQRRGSSYQLPNGYHWNSNVSPHEKLLQTEEEKMKLLRMVYELQDQLKTCFLNESADARVKWNNHQNQMRYSSDALEGENHFYPQQPGRYREVSNWPHQCEYSYRPSSADITDFGQQLDGYCSCSSEEWQSSVQLPQPTLLHTKGSCSIHSGVNSHNAYNSCPASPLRRVDPKIPLYIRGTKSGDQGHREYAVHKYNREKQQSVKRLLRPIAGAAPFISCSNCLKLLQLPAGFLLFNKRCHRLRCGACQKVHEFSLVGRSHLVPYTPVVKTAPRSEVDGCADSVDGRHLSSSAYEHHRIPSVGPGSCSDETGKKASCRDKVQKKESAEPSSSVSKSKKVYSKNAELPARGGWPLHQLMGYSSPSQVIYERGGASGVGSSSYFSAGDISIEEPERFP